MDIPSHKSFDVKASSYLDQRMPALPADFAAIG